MRTGTVIDQRKTPTNERVTAAERSETLPDLIPVVGKRLSIVRPVVDLCQSPSGKRDRQMLWGETAIVYENREGWSFVQAERDGYVGYVDTACLGVARTVTHWVAAQSTHLRREPSVKSPDIALLSMGSKVRVISEDGQFFETPDGYLPQPHLRELGDWAIDPVSVAESFLGIPYLWGGNSCLGLDCSGLVQAAMLACGIACEGDSDLQERTLGVRLSPNASMRRGDILFWSGHVGLVAGEFLLHANAFHMAVAREPLGQAIPRIAEQGGGAVTALKRL